MLQLTTSKDFMSRNYEDCLNKIHVVIINENNIAPHLAKHISFSGLLFLIKKENHRNDVLVNSITLAQSPKFMSVNYICGPTLKVDFPRIDGGRQNKIAAKEKEYIKLCQFCHWGIRFRFDAFQS